MLNVPFLFDHVKSSGLIFTVCPECFERGDEVTLFEALSLVKVCYNAGTICLDCYETNQMEKIDKWQTVSVRELNDE